MKPTFLAVSLCLTVCGCSGLEMKATNSIGVDRIFSDENHVNGYIVYEPMTVVEITKEASCEKKNKEGECERFGIERCKVGTPFYLPNYNRPYIVNSRSGFGKAGVDIAISNGWQLGAIKDNTDNSAMLSFASGMMTMTGVQRQTPSTSEEREACPVEGLYKLELTNVNTATGIGALELTPLKDYVVKQK